VLKTAPQRLNAFFFPKCFLLAKKKDFAPAEKITNGAMHGWSKRFNI